jgi:3-dehydroquinate dehydratase/shikimate dehydrogenase
MEDKISVRICVPVCETNFTAMKQAAMRAAKIGELVELRLDYLEADELRNSRNDITELLTGLRQTIVTLRPAEEGGRQALERADRIVFWMFGKPRSAEFFDIEAELAAGLLADEFSNQYIDWSRVICSYHDFVGVPADLSQVYERMAATPARILKIAVQADDVTDCIPIFRFLEQARKEGREMIAIAMGIAGIVTRILGPSRGAFLTYGALKQDSASAPGQLTVSELEDLFHIRDIDRATEIIGLVGSPVSHSISPHIHNAAFEATGVNAVYIPFEVQNVASFLKRMVHPVSRELDWNIRGLSVTAPHKSAVMDLLTWIEPAAQEMGAVNTILVEDNQLYGYNTDGAALVQPLLDKVGDLRDTRCAVVGAGGASRAALWSLRREGAVATVFARDVNKARSFAETFGAEVKPLTGSLFTEFDVVINTTPLGTRGALAEETVAVASQLRGARLAYDLVYNPSETRFLREAREAGCETLGGVAMLIAQAGRQFELWTGIDAPREVISEAAARALGNQ